MSSQYQLAIFLKLTAEAAVAAAEDTSSEQISRVIPYVLDVDTLNQETYPNFLKEVRELMSVRKIGEVPVLTAQRKFPSTWLELTLKARVDNQAKETMLKIRGDNLYVIGYQTQGPPKTWYEVKNQVGIHYISKSKFLSFPADYPPMVKKAGLHSITEVPLTKSAFITAVKTLADPKPEEEAGVAMAIIQMAQMVSEACRFVRMAEYFGTYLMEPTAYLEDWMMPCLERDWKCFSSIVLLDEAHPGKDIVARTTAEDLLSRLGIILDVKIIESYDDDDDDDALPDTINLQAQLQNIVVERAERLD